MRYAVVHNDSKVVKNVIEWDGVAKWSPPEGHHVRQSEECGRGDVWIEELQEFARPMSLQKPPEDEASIDQRRKDFEEAKAKFNSGLLHVNDQGLHEI